MEGELQENIRQIVQVLEGILGRRSRWNGEAVLENGLFFAGAARYSGSIGISEVIFADPDLCWRTLIHEALHMFSPQYTHLTYLNARGWEEGVVEQMQRLLRPTILIHLGVTVSEKANAAVEQAHPYNKYIAVLEDLRLRLGEEPEGFYSALLATPLPERAMRLKQSSILLDVFDRQEFSAFLLKAIFVLNR